MIIFLHYTPITGPILHSLFDHWFNFQLDAHSFITKGERHIFTFTLFFRESPWSPYHFLFMELDLKVELRICGYRWSIDLVIVCFLHLCSHLIVDTFMTPECSSYIQISDCHPRTMSLHVVCCLLRSYLVSFIHFVCIVGSHFRSWLSLESHSWRGVGGQLIRADSHQSSDSSVEMSDELASTLASIQEFMAGVSRCLDQIESSR